MRWSLTIYALIGLSLFCDAVLASSPTATETLLEPRSPETDSPSSSSSSSARTLPVHDVGLPSELAWQAWLVVASKPDSQSSFESATVPRRISPKSVFVAPRLENNRPCSDGYKADGFGGCETDTIKINPQDHWNFVIERINAMYPKGVGLDDSEATSSELKHSALSGPLQVNISLGIDDNSPPSWSKKSEDEKQDFDDFEDSVEISVLQVPPQKAALTSDVKPATKTEAALTLYKVENGTKTGEEKEKEPETFFRFNSSKPVEDHPVREVVVPVAELIDDGNQTFAEVIDYEIPLSLKQLFNISHGDSKESESSAKNITKTESADSTRLPTVVLLLSPSKLTTASSTSHTKEINPDKETSIDQIFAKTENLTAKSTDKETAPVTIGGPNSPSENIDDKDDEVTDSDYGFEETTLYETTDVISTTIYLEEDLDQTTEWNDEILAHGEAESMVSEDNSELSASTNDSKRPMVLTKDNTFDNKTTEEESSNISSESSIRGDVIVETTLLDLNTEVITGATPTHEEFDDYRELFEAEKEISLEPEVVFSPQDVHRLDRTNTRDTKRAGDSTAKSSVEHRQPISFLTRTVPPIVNFDDVSTAHSSPRKTMERYASRPNEHTIPKENPIKRTYTNQDYVRFPEESKQPSSSGYVLFPSDRSNRVNGGNLRYKESSAYATGSAVPQVVPKTNAPLNQRNTHWRLPPGWRIDDLQPPPQPVALQNVNQRQNPMLLRFWTRMPLFRDPSLTSSSRVLPMVTQRGSIYRQMSAQAVNRGSPETVRGSNPVQQFG